MVGPSALHEASLARRRVIRQVRKAAVQGHMRLHTPTQHGQTSYLN